MYGLFYMTIIHVSYVFVCVCAFHVVAHSFNQSDDWCFGALAHTKHTISVAIRTVVATATATAHTHSQ